MAVDKDNPRSWVKFRSEMCTTCIATCCTMPLEVKFDDLVRLEVVTEDDRQEPFKKIAKRLASDGIVRSYREATELFMIEHRPNGDCIFLDKTRRCSVYDRRPETCRKFPSIGNNPGRCPYIKK